MAAIAFLRRNVGIGVLAAAMSTVIARAEPVLLGPAMGSQVPQVWYLEDPGRSLRIDEVAVADKRFRRYEGANPNFGYSTSNFWLRFAAARQPESAGPWYLRVEYPPLDRAELYWRVEGDRSRFAHMALGDSLPFGAREIMDPHYYFPLALGPGESNVFYLLVRTDGAVTVPMSLLSQETMDRDRGQMRIILGLFFGTLLALALYHLLLFATMRDLSYLLFSGFVLISTLAFFSFNGLAYEYLWPDAVWWNDRAPFMLALLSVGAFALFTRNFFAVRRLAPRLDGALIALSAIAGVAALLALGAISFRAAARLFAVLGIVSALAILAAGFICLRRGDRTARWFLLAWAVMMLGLASYGLRTLGALSGSVIGIYGFQIGVGIGFLLLSVALAHRINIVMRGKLQPNAGTSAAELHIANDTDSSVQVQLVELNQLNRKLQDEISERRRAEDALFEMAHHDALTGLPNRLLLSDRFQIAAAQANRSGRELALLMLDLDDFKQVNDTLGHNIGDALLVKVAEEIENSVRASDTVARFGGDEFVVLLGNMIDSDEAAHVAEKIIKSLAEVRRIKRHELRVASSIGIALYPQDGLDMTALLKCADIAMYRAKRAGGNNYYFFTEARQRQLSLPAVQRE